MPLPQPLIQYCNDIHIAVSIAENTNDHPLLYVNQHFEQLTGYGKDELYGKNCRILQNKSNNDYNKSRIREFLKKDSIESIRVPLINFKKNGTPFINLLFMSKIKNCLNNTQYLFASQFDVSNTYPDILSHYEHTLKTALIDIPKTVRPNSLILSGSLSVVANATAAIAQAKVMLDQADAPLL
ncbi:PAS domain-containing protein [Neokomagataea thailandica]|uniref:Signal transduction histidine kinase n=1 Tax=Neokomagataea tanensis NBRC 106556 TaxID=1223519 RepID=A0ABQ0QKV5_9PROT|nr:MULTISPECIES: PAS domain-containing protein [Neokomagataea]GBR48473.1 signal transduction histidine kinase [Neokomagataea tanensis NBRC 106556]